MQEQETRQPSRRRSSFSQYALDEIAVLIWGENMNDKVTCNCSGCTYTEKAKDKDFPYRYLPTKRHIVFHLLLHLALPVIGVFLIGINSWTAVPVLSSFAAYLLTCFFFCSKCSYHHENVLFCGCFPKSVFPYRKYQKWGTLENLLGWPLAIFLLVGPTILVLVKMNDWNGLKIYFAFLVCYVLIHGTFSCPNCRQRSLCYLGKLVLFIKKRKLSDSKHCSGRARNIV